MSGQPDPSDPSDGRATIPWPDPKNRLVGPRISKTDPTQPMSHTRLNTFTNEFKMKDGRIEAG